jgi:pyruvate/2-oxoglutarate/acetoin dehydrogenase E1 component/TPP-dependent pyruvate/acetoin dehydrogenase alpha subunit
MIDNPVFTKSIEQSGGENNEYIREVLKDFWTCCVSRETSLLGRKEVLTGKAKFGILGDGKEVPQVALARAFKKGDWRSGYYRDQTLMFALGLSSVEDFFAQLYADSKNDPFSGGRQMNSHYATGNIDNEGQWTEHKSLYNISSDISSTGGQMGRALGLALASKKYRESELLRNSTKFSENGNEVCFCTIGDASTSEGVFWETINAAGVLKVPLAISIWDDGYGISVPKKYQTTKGDISEVLEGFRLDDEGQGLDIYRLKGWDYPTLCEVYEKGIEKMRRTHIPAVFHVEELTQPQGHSTSGSHERYKGKERLEWEKKMDCIKVMRQWIIDTNIATEKIVDEIAAEAKVFVKNAKNRAWNNYMDPVKKELNNLKSIYERILEQVVENSEVERVYYELNKFVNPLFAEILQNARRMLFFTGHENVDSVKELRAWISKAKTKGHNRYHTNLYSSSKHSALKVPVVSPTYSETSKKINGYQVLNNYFDKLLDRTPNLFAFGEDVGYIGDVNQGFAGMQDKYGKERVFDTGIRESTIMGQAIGMAMRGLRPIAEIQYLDYLIYGLQPLTDDLATLRYRSNGLQQAPAIIRTRGHRLEGIWHAGSPMGMLIHSLRGIYICVPRNMTQAVGFYNTLMQSDDPGLVVECLNGYRLKERLPDNIGDFTVPLGVPDILKEGEDVTLVTYGSCVRIAKEGIGLLERKGVSVELIDIQTLLPFDLEHRIVESLKKTNRIVFMDEDVPGGATSYMMQEVLENQGGYQYLDSSPKTLTAKAHRPPFGSDGDYFSKPNVEDVFNIVYDIMHEVDPFKYPEI